MIICAYLCEDCECGFEDDIHVRECPNCESSHIRKDWSRYSVGIRVDPGRVDKDGYLRKFGAKDDPLTAIELGLKDRNSSLRTCSDEQVADIRQKVIRGEDSPQVRQEVLDIRAKNINKFRSGNGKRGKKK